MDTLRKLLIHGFINHSGVCRHTLPYSSVVVYNTSWQTLAPTEQSVVNMVTQKQKQKQEDEVKENEKSRRENLGKFFYDLAKSTFTIMVLANAAALFTTENYLLTSIMFVVGVIATVVLARIGYSIFKK